MWEKYLNHVQAACGTGTFRTARFRMLSSEFARFCLFSISTFFAPVVLLVAGQHAAAQQLTAIYPRHAVAQTETRFTVEGVALPTADSAQAGLKLSTVPAGSCQNAKRYKAATTERYYFSCSFDTAPTPVLIRIHNKTSGKSDFLGSFAISVLHGPPVLAHLTISGNVVSSNARVRCEIGAACVTLAGDLTASDTISVEVKGANLPPELYFEVEGCLQASASQPNPRDDIREASCTVAAGAGSRKIRILSAAPTRGGNELWKTDLNAATP